MNALKAGEEKGGKRDELMGGDKRRKNGKKEPYEKKREKEVRKNNLYTVQSSLDPAERKEGGK